MKERLTIIFTNDNVVPYLETSEYPIVEWVCPKNRLNHYCNLYGGLGYEGLTGWWHRKYYKKGELQLPRLDRGLPKERERLDKTRLE